MEKLNEILLPELYCLELEFNSIGQSNLNDNFFAYGFEEILVLSQWQPIYRCSLGRDESTQWTHDHPGLTLLLILVIEKLSHRIHTGCQSPLKSVVEFWGLQGAH